LTDPLQFLLCPAAELLFFLFTHVLLLDQAEIALNNANRIADFMSQTGGEPAD